MNDKGGLAANEDFGKDEAAVDKLLTKQNALEADILAYSSVVQGLAQDARRLVNSGHFDGTKIAERQVHSIQTTSISLPHSLESKTTTGQRNPKET